VSVHGHIDFAARILIPQKPAFAFPVAAGPVKKGVRRDVDYYTCFAFRAIAALAFPAGIKRQVRRIGVRWYLDGDAPVGGFAVSRIAFPAASVRVVREVSVGRRFDRDAALAAVRVARNASISPKASGGMNAVSLGSSAHRRSS
jgi:hypothetical protein